MDRGYHKVHHSANSKLTIRKLGENQEHVEDDQVFNSGGRAYFMPISSDLISVPQNELEFTFMTDNPLIPYQPIVPQTCSEDSACVGSLLAKALIAKFLSTLRVVKPNWPLCPCLQISSRGNQALWI